MQDFINYLESKNHSKTTQKAYLRNVNLFLEWYITEQSEGYERSSVPINCTKKDIIKYNIPLSKSVNSSFLATRTSK